MILNDSYERFQRQIILPGFGIESQQMLATTSVLVVGVGGLGCPLLVSLNAMGIGTIGMIDDDVVELSNLPRQILFGDADVGRAKVRVAEDRLRQLNTKTTIHSHALRCDVSNALQLLGAYDIIVDATDSFPTRYCLNDACVILGKPLVYAAVQEFHVHLSVFNVAQSDRSRSGTLRCIFPQPPDPLTVRGCDVGGVLGVTTQLAATIMAAQVVGLATNSIDVLSNTLLDIETRSMETQRYTYERREDQWLGAPRDVSAFRLMDYASWCGEQTVSENEIGLNELLSLIESARELTVVDIRESNERTSADALSTIQISLSELETRHVEIPSTGLVVLMCTSGTRSLEAVRELQRKYNRTNVRSLRGGYNEWFKTTRSHTEMR